MNVPDSKFPRIVIVGGGFAGITLAKTLRNQPFQIVLIDRHNYHTFQPLLYQVSSAGLEPDSIAYPLRKIIKKHRNTIFRMAEVRHINTNENYITTDIGQLNYDFLVIATGTKTNFFGNQSIETHSMPMKKVPQALNIRSLFLQNFEKATIAATSEDRLALLTFVIVGGGPTGVELAGALAELKNHVLPHDYPDLNISDMRIHLLEGNDRLLSSMSTHASIKAELFLKQLGVEVSCNTFVEHYDGKTVSTGSGKNIKSEAMIWAAGVTGDLVQGLNSESTIVRMNRLKVDRFNGIQGYENIFALGDIAYMETPNYPYGHPQVAQPAIQQGKLLGKNLLRQIRGLPMRPFVYKDKGSMATIGRNKAVVDLKRVRFAGFFAWFVWMFIHLMALVGFRNRVIVFFNWTYNYINFDKAARLIIRPFRK